MCVVVVLLMVSCDGIRVYRYDCRLSQLMVVVVVASGLVC